MIDVDSRAAAQERIAELSFVVGCDDGERRIFCLDLAESRDC